jgi:alpha-glucoside transport system substrate-binding protein
VSNALKTVLQVINSQNVKGGADAVLSTGFQDGIAQVFGKSPKAELYMEGGFVGGIALGLNKSLKPGKTIQEAPFPTIKAQFDSPVVGGGDVAVAFNKNDNVKALLNYLASPEAGKVWVSTGAIISPNKGVPASAYPNVLAQAEAKQLGAAKTFLFDGSDTLPGSLSETWATTLQNVIKNPNNMSKLLSQFQSQAKPAFQQANG